MKNQYNIEPFTPKYLEPAVELFIRNYRDERANNPLLPSRASDEPEWILEILKPLVANPGVAVLQDNQLNGYMITGFFFPFKGQNAVLVPVFCHGSVTQDRQELYQRMYMELAGEWARKGKHLHIINHFAHDSILQETLFQLGFGAFVTERLRDLTPVKNINSVKISEETDYRKLVDIQIEHMQYYPNSPIFISKKDKIRNAGPDLESHLKNGDVFLVYYEGSSPGAYFIVGDSTTGKEGFLLQKTGTVQIKSAYAQPHLQGKGIGKAMLQAAVEWAQQHGYRRLMVEHETANYYGGNFWRKHFHPYLYFSLRYIENTVNKDNTT
jgi:GNAT superfamily N-acetyltransferase